MEKNVVCEEGMSETTMSKSTKALLALLRMAIHRHVQSVEDHVNWQEVLTLAQRQGVRGLAYEALEQMKQGGAECTGFPDRMLLLQWYAQTAFVEKTAAQH